MDFDWINSTDTDLAKHIASVPASNTTQQLRYYERMENTEMINRIKKARVEAKKWRILLKAEKLGATLPPQD